MTVSPIAWADPARAGAFAGWLAAMARQHPMQADSVRLASADASFRRYFRVDAAGGTNAEPGTGSYIIMDAPPAQEDCRPFVKVAGLMQDAGLNAPRVLAWDEPLGFMLLSDLGAQTLLDVIAPPSEVDAIAQPTAAHHDLYMDAVDALVRWQLASRPSVLPPYDEALLSRELALFPDWYVARHRGIALDAGLQGKLDGLFAQIKASNLQSLGGARVYVHRDFMPRNLMVAQFSDGPPLGKLAPSGGSAVREATSVGATSIGVLDFQDAVYGPVTYDITCLFKDAFLSWPQARVREWQRGYWQRAGALGIPVQADFEEFLRASDLMGVQRHLKVIGIFARICHRDGKPRYLADVPRFFAYIEAVLADRPELSELGELLASLRVEAGV